MSAETAAWVSAGAAVIQAVGAVAAIWVSVSLARQSAARERRADEEATRRGIEADARAAERITQADRAAEARTLRERVEAHNALVSRVSSFGALLAEKASAAATDAERQFSTFTGDVIGDLQVPHVGEYRDLLTLAKQESADIHLIEAIGRVQDAVQFPTINQLGSKFVQTVKGQVDELYEALRQVDDCLR